MKLVILGLFYFIALTQAAQCRQFACPVEGTFSLSQDDFISDNNVSLIDSNGNCCRWNPLAIGSGSPRDPLSVTLSMQTTDDLLVATNDTLLNLTIQLSGGDLAIRACLPSFSFTLLASTADANGLTGNGGFFWNDGSVLIPLNYAPSSANYTALPLTLTVPSSNAVPIYANFFNDGSLRITGYQGVPLPAGTYTVQAACIIYNARRNVVAAPKNTRISDANCISTVALTTSVQSNRETLFADYYEYFGMDYYNAIGYIAGVENCYPGSNNGSKWFNRTDLISFYKIAISGQTITRLSYIPTLDASLTLDSQAVLQNQFSFTGRTTFIDQIETDQQEPGIAVSRLNASNIAMAFATFNNPVSTGGWEVPFSVDGGLTWDLVSVNLPNQVGIPGTEMLPYPQIFQTFPFTCGVGITCLNSTNQTISVNSTSDSACRGGTIILTPHCPPDDGDVNITSGNETRATSSIYPDTGGDNRMTVDAFDVFWQVGLYDQGVFPNDHANVEITFSLDYGKTWALAADLDMDNSTTYSYDYNVVAAGSDGGNGSQFCVAIKVDENLNELIAFGTILPIELNCFHTSQRGLVDHIDRITVPGTNPGHYGGMTIDQNGFIYLVLQGMQPVVTNPFTGNVIGTGLGPLGSNTQGNAPILFTICSPSPGVNCQMARVIARSDLGLNCPNPQPNRCTWSQPQIVVDNDNNLYVFWYDAVHNPLPTAEQATIFFEPPNQGTRILMIKSCDHGESWTAPQSINDDATDPQDPYTTPNVHFNLNAKYDPQSNSILVAWMDSRVDPTTQTGVQIFAAVVTL